MQSAQRKNKELRLNSAISANSAVKLSVFDGEVVFEGPNLSALGKIGYKGHFVACWKCFKKNSTGAAKFEIISWNFVFDIGRISNRHGRKS